jgi:hypothetical protein
MSVAVLLCVRVARAHRIDVRLDGQSLVAVVGEQVGAGELREVQA